MSIKNQKILIIDDDPIIKSLISDFLSTEDCIPLSASDAETGLKLLKEQPDIAAVILDWMLPEMNGLDCLRQIKSQSQFHRLPVIMQTGRNDKDSIVHGINAGAYYYLTKPYNFNVLMTILKRAINDFNRMEEGNRTSESIASCVCGLLFHGKIAVRTPKEAVSVASYLAKWVKQEKVQIGMTELLINGIEHGILGIGYEKKEELLMDDILDEEIEKRLKTQAFLDKSVQIAFDKTSYELNIEISDPGSGFDYMEYLSVDHDRVYDLHGRGIAMANMIFGKGMQYIGTGNIVRIRIPLSESVE